MHDVRQLKVIDILLVEDDEGDLVIVQEAFTHYKIRNALHVTRDGRQALRFLRREPPYAAAARPDLVLLDVNLPGVDGRQVLAEIRADPELRTIPVVVLTGSESEADIARGHGTADAYVTKPVDFERLLDIVRAIDGFFVAVTSSPPRQPVSSVHSG
ncbi:response regulator [Actinokineospora sp. NBRC 105648]|uniref:response regulator n=1 Tax=Actinokineospora sp. NBRC 105648 TaxID=3032206 RepID=UPI0024A2F5EB|nr:response regulator [Actinokineospora sp. NBRC 105648]GLZ42278.1 two-component system response regulator [Actinokineospora sp. NBRC 105648]